MSTTPASDPGHGKPLEPDPVIEAYKRDIDRGLLRENLKLTPDQRVRRLSAFLRLVGALQRAGRKARGS